MLARAIENRRITEASRIDHHRFAVIWPANERYRWVEVDDKCDLMVDQQAFLGRVSADGRFISFVTTDDEQVAKLRSGMRRNP